MPGETIPTIPIVDFNGFGDGTSQEALNISKELIKACKSSGFAYLINLDISNDQVKDMFAWSAKFHNLPHDVKMKARHPPEGWKHRGYSGVGVEQVSQSVFEVEPNKPLSSESIRAGKFPDYKETFDFGNEGEGEGSKVRPGLENIWVPENDLPGFRRAAMGFYDACRHVQITQLLPALSIGLGLEKGYLNRFHETAQNQVRLAHYPEGPLEMFEMGLAGRIGAHTDYGTCTFLFQDDVGGLEVDLGDGRGFLGVPPIPIPGAQAAVFNVADMLMRWSNDTLKSTLHRVRPPPPTKKQDSVSANMDGHVPERYSLPYFMGPDSDTLVDCLPGCWGPGNPKKYEPITAMDYLDMRMNATY